MTEVLLSAEVYEAWSYLRAHMAAKYAPMRSLRISVSPMAFRELNSFFVTGHGLWPEPGLEVDPALHGLEMRAQVRL